MVYPGGKIVLNEKNTNRVGSSQSKITGNLCGKSTKPKSKKSTSHSTLQSQNFVGRRRQSPAPDIFGTRTKTPLKLLHYHKKKQSMWNPHLSKPIVACSINKYNPKQMSNQEKEDLLLSSVESEDMRQNEYNYLDEDIDALCQPEYKYQREYEKSDQSSYSIFDCDKRRKSEIYSLESKNMTQLNSPTEYFNKSEKPCKQFGFGKESPHFIEAHILNYKTQENVQLKNKHSRSKSNNLSQNRWYKTTKGELRNLTCRNWSQRYVRPFDQPRPFKRTTDPGVWEVWKPYNGVLPFTIESK